MPAWTAKLILALVALLIIAPIFLATPFADEWLRLHDMRRLSFWEWSHGHMRVWVVRPFADYFQAALAQ